MVSNGSLRDLVLITHDEYISLKKQEKKLDGPEKQKHQILSNVVEFPATIDQSSVEEKKVSEVEQAIPEQTVVAQLNLNSRFLGQKKEENRLEKNQFHQKSSSDQVLSNLLESGLTGGKVERSRQILKKIADCERTALDETSETIILDQQDTGISVVDFLSALQVNTKQLPKKFLTLVEVLRLPQFLLANTYARHTSVQNHHHIRSANGESPYKRLKLDTDNAQYQWLTIK